MENPDPEVRSSRMAENVFFYTPLPSFHQERKSQSYIIFQGSTTTTTTTITTTTTTTTTSNNNNNNAVYCAVVLFNLSRDLQKRKQV